MNQKKIGIILSYTNLLLSMGINIFITPFLINTLGDVDYSIYKVIQSFAGPLSMFNLGISTIVVRAIVKGQMGDEDSQKRKSNTIALSLIASSIMSFVVIVAATIMYFSIPSLYGSSYNDESILLGQRIFVLFVGATILRIITDCFSGCIVGHERFSVSSGIPVCSNILKTLLYYGLLKSGMGVVGVVFTDFLLALVIFVFSLWYVVTCLHEVPRYYSMDKQQIIEILSFGFAILLQAIVNQVNNNLDTMILGVYVNEKSIITMYSSALAIYSIYNSLISVIANFFLPQATILVTKNASGKELTDFVIHPGRFQAMIAIGAIFGFALFGKNFISVWIGEKYINAYYVTLMLIIPVTIPLVENAAISILDATLKRVYRSIVLVIMAIINIIISLILIRWIGYWGAALGTVLSLVIGHGFMMNYYYAKTFNMEILRLFREIFRGILPVGLVSAIPCVFIASWSNGVIALIVKCLVYIIAYGIGLWTWGLTAGEKDIIRNMINSVVLIKKVDKK